ncbi:MAG TPA: DUF2076 domain-containing protein [Methylocella sp.]
MSPEERQLLTGLFDRIRSAATTPRDQEAEALIQDATKAQPYAPYYLAQTVLVQDQALRAANDRLQELEGKVKDLESQAASGPRPGGFLSGLGSLFGGSGPSSAPRAGMGMPPPGSAPRAGMGMPPQGGWQQPPQGYAPPGAAPGPWGGGQGGGFLTGALGTAAGVAGGVLLADSIRGLFTGHNNPLGIGSGFGGTGPGLGGETVVNNYYDSGGQSLSQQDAAQDAQQDAADDAQQYAQQDAQQDADQDQDDIQDASDYGSDGFGSDDDGSYDV